MSTVESRLYVLGKTKSSDTWHLVESGRVSWCNHEVVGDVRTDVTYRDMFGWNICAGCYHALMSAENRENL